MTFYEACDKAQNESKNGYVQHVNRSYFDRDSDCIDYSVSDWYDSDTTVKSYENGREL